MSRTIENPSKATWAVAYSDTATHKVELGPGLYMITGQPNLLQAESENAIMGKIAGAGINSKFPAIPDRGEEVQAGEIYRLPDNSLVMARQSHTRTEHAPADVPALFVVYRADAGDTLQWVPGELIEVGQKREHNGITYVAIQKHLTIEGQTPDILPALWEVEASGAEWQIGVAYSIGDIVTYQGSEYECIQAHTAIVGWQPPNVPALWNLIP